jgi:hypothetical protein
MSDDALEIPSFLRRERTRSCEWNRRMVAQIEAKRRLAVLRRVALGVGGVLLFLAGFGTAVLVGAA